jgi:hypothetical protein
VDPALMSAVSPPAETTPVDPQNRMSPGLMSLTMAASTAPPPGPPLAEPAPDRMGVGRWLTSGWRPAVLGCAAGALMVTAATWRPHSVPAAQRSPVEVVELAPPPVPRPAGAHIEPLQAAAAEGLPLQLQNDGPRARLRMPLAGKSKGAQQRRLSDPPGIGVTLPQARPFIPAGVYNAANGPLRVEVQRRGAGSEVLFLYDPRTHGASVNVDGDAILVELTTKN